MRIIAVWIAVAAVIGLVFIEYMVMTPVVERFQDEVNSSNLNNTDAITFMDQHITMKDRLMNITPYLAVVVMLLWGFMWSQQRETITGVYS